MVLFLQQPKRTTFLIGQGGGQQDRYPTSFDDYRKELWGSLKISHEQYDKAIITLSSGGLALSLTLLKDIFQVEKLSWPNLLIAAWFLFFGAIASTVFSFLTSQKGITVQLDYFEQYVAGDNSYWNKKNPYILATTWLNYVSGVLFLLAIISMTSFSAVNFYEKVKYVKKDRRFEQGTKNTTNATKNTGYTRYTSSSDATETSEKVVQNRLQ